jgi:hypothetical protein
MIDLPSQTALAAPRAERDAQIVRVITQYWRGDARVCELECDGRDLDVHMSRADESLWIAEAHSDHTVEAFVIVGTGTSRSAALLAVAAAWREKAPMVGLRRFDWEAIAQALRGVNACD